MGRGPPLGTAGQLSVVTKWYSHDDSDIMQQSPFPGTWHQIANPHRLNKDEESRVDDTRSLKALPGVLTEVAVTLYPS